MVRCTWDRIDNQAAEQTAHPSAVRAGGRVLSSNGCTQIDEEPEKEGRAPKTDSDWAEIEHHAIQLAASGALIALGGTGQADAGWAQSPDWQNYSQELASTGLALIAAARSKSQEALVKGNGQLVEVCESCHKEFKPDLPTEGITHTHTH